MNEICKKKIKLKTKQNFLITETVKHPHLFEMWNFSIICAQTLVGLRMFIIKIGNQLQSQFTLHDTQKYLYTVHPNPLAMALKVQVGQSNFSSSSIYSLFN